MFSFLAKHWLQSQSKVTYSKRRILHKVSLATDKIYAALQKPIIDRYKYHDSGAVLVIKPHSIPEIDLFKNNHHEWLDLVHSTSKLAFGYNLKSKVQVIDDCREHLTLVYPNPKLLTEKEDYLANNPYSDLGLWNISSKSSTNILPLGGQQIDFFKNYENITEISSNGQRASATNLPDILKIAHLLLPPRNDLLSLKVYPYQHDNKIIQEKGYWVCEVSSPFRFPDRWLGLAGTDLELVTNCDGVMFAEESGQRILCKSMSVAQILSGIAKDKIRSNFLLERFYNIFTPGVLLLDRYHLNWQKDLYEFEKSRKFTASDVNHHLFPKLVIYSTGRQHATAKIKWIIKSIKTEAFYREPESNKVNSFSINDLENTVRFVFPKAVRGRTILEITTKYPKVKPLFNFLKLKEPEKIKFDDSGLACECWDRTEAMQLSMLLIDYLPTFEEICK